MLSRRLFRNLKQIRPTTQVFNNIKMFSSTEEPAPVETPVKEEAAAPTQQEMEQGRHEWGIKYDDECLKFEKEWQMIAEQVENEQMVFVENELGDLQQEKVNLLVDKVLQLNMFELRYFQSTLTRKIQKTTGINPLKLNMDWPSIKQDDAGTWPPANPNWFK